MRLIHLGIALVGAWTATALLAPHLAPFDPLLSWDPLLLPGAPDSQGIVHWLGTDLLGRDILSRLIFGTRPVLSLAFGAAALSYGLGVAGGLSAGYFGGRTDLVLSFLADLLLAFPVLVLYILIIVALGASFANVVIAVLFASVPPVFRLSRALARDLKGRDFVAAAILQGEAAWRILFIDILPNAAGPLAADFCLKLGYAAIMIGSLGYLGLGLPPPAPDWGGMVNDGRSLAFAYPHLVLFPCLAITSLVWGLSLIADGLRHD